MFSQLRHPNIVHFYGAGVPPSLFYVMELCQRSLFDLLHICRRALDTRQRVAIAVRRHENPRVHVCVNRRVTVKTENLGLGWDFGFCSRVEVVRRCLAYLSLPVPPHPGVSMRGRTVSTYSV